MITVIDSIMGSGKSSFAFQMINDAPLDQNFLYITPFLSEVERVIGEVNRPFVEPTHKDDGYTKYEDIQQLIENKNDIASTHFLFSKFDKSFEEKIKEGKYTLILDEVLDVVEPFTGLKTKDVKLLKEKELIRVNEEGFIIWNNEEYVESRYEDIATLANNNQLVMMDDKIFLWHYPKEIFTAFENVYILTYMFEASVIKAYFDLYNLEYEKKSVIKTDKYEMVDYFIPNREHLQPLIHIYQGRLNTNISQKENVLSASWVESKVNEDDMKQIKNNVYNFFTNIHKTSTEELYWTTYKNAIPLLKGKGYAKSSCFVACNSRATNEYADRYILAYVVNRYMNPMVAKFFLSRGVRINNDLFAFSEMVQWIWRSRIRRGEEIYIYIPSKRMRTLLGRWLYGHDGYEDINTY